MSHKILAMLHLQDQMNKKIHPEWYLQNFEWYRAVWIECAELMDHHGWKWWKHQSPDIEQIKLELVDIWHFGLSMLVQNMGITNLTADMIDVMIEYKRIDYDDIPSAVEALSQDVLDKREFSVPIFAGLMKAADFSFEELHQMYIGKNVLNFFRQDHGYKEGSYIKHWQGREDNEHLMDLIAELNPDDANFKDQLYQALENRYQQLTTSTEDTQVSG